MSTDQLSEIQSVAFRLLTTRCHLLFTLSHHTDFYMSLRTTVPMIHCTDCTHTAEGTDYTHTQLKALITHRASSEPVLLPVRSWFDLRALYEPVTFPQAREPIQSQVLRH